MSLLLSRALEARFCQQDRAWCRNLPSPLFHLARPVRCWRPCVGRGPAEATRLPRSQPSWGTRTYGAPARLDGRRSSATGPILSPSPSTRTTSAARLPSASSSSLRLMPSGSRRPVCRDARRSLSPRKGPARTRRRPRPAGPGSRIWRCSPTRIPSSSTRSRSRRDHCRRHHSGRRRQRSLRRSRGRPRSSPRRTPSRAASTASRSSSAPAVAGVLFAAASIGVVFTMTAALIAMSALFVLRHVHRP